MPRSTPSATTASHMPAGAGEVLLAFAAGMTSIAQVGVGILRLPYDAARAQHARGVQLGLVESSLLASRDFEHALGALERSTLGPLARRR
jgi:hypothetical protein